MSKPVKTKNGGLRPNEVGRKAREQRAYDRRNGYTPALVEKVTRLIAKTPARDYPVYFLRYSRFYRLELVSRMGDIVTAVDVVNDDTNECFAGWVIDTESLFRAASGVQTRAGGNDAA